MEGVMRYGMLEALGLDEAYVEAGSDSIESVNKGSSSAIKKVEHSASDVEEKYDAESQGADDILTEVIVQFEDKFESNCVVAELEDAYLLYSEYARLKGFSVRRGGQRYVGNTSNLRWKQFLCSAAGPPNTNKSERKVTKSRKQVTRTDCTAKIRVHPLDGGFKITTFDKEHNHQLVPADQTYLLRSHRHLTEERQSLLKTMRLIGIPVNVVCRFMETECGRASNLGFIMKDVYDHLRRAKMCGASNENGDAVALLEYFNRKSNEEPCFFWKANYSNEGRLLHFFMRDTRSLNDYLAFSDILSIDTTYRTNKYNLSCVPFVGLNHHNTNVMFGIGFLSNEKTETFHWLLDTSLESMEGKQPRVIFSDQCAALMNAIDEKFPSTTHRLCQWHINNNATKHFGALNKNLEFKRLWYKCMNGVETEAEFDELWTQMMAHVVRPEQAKWLRDIYSLRQRWASVFSQHIFTAGMLATTRSEGTNRVLKAFSRSSNSLSEFATAYEKIQSRWREMEAAEDTACICLPGQFVSQNSLLVQAATLYTRSIYKKFETQLIEALNVEVDSENARLLGDNKMVFKAIRSGNTTARARTIIFDRFTKDAQCSCFMWESHGIICRHILRVYIVRNVRTMPEKFFLKRWTKVAKRIDAQPIGVGTQRATDKTTPHMDFVHVVMREQFAMAAESKDSIVSQRFIYQQLEYQKRGLALLRHGGVPQPQPAPMPGPEHSNFQFLNPLKVKDRYEDNASSKRGKRKKAPGISTTKSRYKSNSRVRPRDDSVEYPIN